MERESRLFKAILLKSFEKGLDIFFSYKEMMEILDAEEMSQDDFEKILLETYNAISCREVKNENDGYTMVCIFDYIEISPNEFYEGHKGKINIGISPAFKNAINNKDEDGFQKYFDSKIKDFIKVCYTSPDIH